MGWFGMDKTICIQCQKDVRARNTKCPNFLACCMYYPYCHCVGNRPPTKHYCILGMSIETQKWAQLYIIQEEEDPEYIDWTFYDLENKPLVPVPFVLN